MNLASIERIHSIAVHPNADSLEIAKVKAWPVVVRKGEFKNGDLVVFIVIDSIVPSSNPYFSFLEKMKYRVWNAKFRKMPSQGLVCPLFILPGYCGLTAQKDGFHMNTKDENGELHYVLDEGDDVTELLGITKYEKPIDVSLNGDALGNFPTHLVPITDEPNLLNYPEALKEFVGETCILTSKADGSSMTVIWDMEQVRVCSRRLELKPGTGMWHVADSYDLANVLRKLDYPIAIQAEVCGPKIQGNPLGLAKPEAFVFNIKHLDTGKWFDWAEMELFCRLNHIPTVQLVSSFECDETITIDWLQEIANRLTYPNGKPAEGIVLRPLVPKYSQTLGRLSAKILNQNY